MADDEPDADDALKTQIAYVDGAPESVHLRRIELTVNPGADDQHTGVFDESVVTIGTRRSNDIVLDDDTVSRNHCRIVEEEDAYLLVDLDSTNGTWINGVRIREAYLSPEMVFRVGNTDIRFSAVDRQVPVEPTETERLGDIVGRSVAMREIFDIVEKIAPTSATVVIEGETGAGKEVVARTIHQLSPRGDEPFVVFDCGAVPESLIESELFGHEKGSFTGATGTRKGLFEVAEGGTIFLDEIGELSPELQPRLLRVLEERNIRRVGSNQPIPVDVRVVAATNRDLEEEVRQGRFRQDLFYRLSVLRLFVPALRERPEDVPLLVDHFLETLECNFDDRDRRRLHDIEPEALQALREYPWPGNVRQLANVVERACSLAESDVIRLRDLPDYVTDLDGGPPADFDDPGDRDWTQVPAKSRLQEQPFKEAKREWIASFERDYLQELLDRHDGNISQSAREADIDRKYFRSLMDKHDIDAADFE